MPLAENRADLLFSSPVAGRREAADAAADDAGHARICDCNDVSKAQIIEAVLSGARSVQAVCDATRASTGCGSCRPEVEAIVALACQGLETPVDAGDFGPSSRCRDAGSPAAGRAPSSR